MPGLSKVIVLDPDVRAGRQVQLGFEREGVPTATIPADAPRLELPGDDAGLVVVGGVDGQGIELVRRTRALLDDRQIDAPILFAGRGIERGDAKAAGADEVVLQPAYLRDVVTVGRLLRGQPSSERGRFAGSLAEVTGVFPLVRALAAMGRSATLHLARGLRRGELRFYHGEVTSAQVGMIHGQAALHQLLLWTDARFEYHHEDIVRRQQIPLTPEELFADAERFLEGVRDSSGGLSPSMVLEQDAPRVQSFGKQIPTEVYGVLRMFDGHRVLADVLEDSAYRVFETLRVAQRAVEVGLLRIVDQQPPRATWRAILSIEEWLVGSEPREPRIDAAPISTQDSGPVARDGKPTTTRDERGKSSRKPRRKKKRRVNTPPPSPSPSRSPASGQEIDWGALVPRIVGAEVGPLAGVVPAAQASGEIVTAKPAVVRDHPAPQPKVVFDEPAEVARPAKAQTAARAKADAVRAKAKAKGDAEARAKADVEARAKADAEVRAQLGAAVEADARANAIRVLAATVSLSTDPAHIVDDLRLDDTKPERLGAPVTPTQTARVLIEGTPAPPLAESTGAAPTAVQAVEAPPAEIMDEPSDGVIRHHITTAETAPVKRRRVPTDPPEDDRPEDAMGEITTPRARATSEPHNSEPSILVSDLAAVHAEVSAIATAQATAPATGDAASPSREAPVLEARGDAVAFSEVEEEFFRAGHEKEAEVILAPPIVESFDDLDEGYQPVGFWDRLRGKAIGQPAVPDQPDQPTLLAVPDKPAAPDKK